MNRVHRFTSTATHSRGVVRQAVPPAPRVSPVRAGAIAARTCFGLVLLFALTGTIHAAGTIFSTVLGGTGQDYATAVTSDAQGNTFVVGLTYSPDFPVTPGAFQTTLGGLYYPDAFVAKIGPTGKIIWATYLGGLIDDYATGVALDSAGNVWVTGWTRSANFPVVNALPKHAQQQQRRNR